MVDIFFVGCGYVGSLVARKWGKDTRSIAALARSEASATKLQAMGLRVCPGDLDDPSTLIELPLHHCLLYYFAPPPAQGQSDTRLRHFLNAIDSANAPRHIVYISTTGVYGDRGGEWVSEQSEPQPQADRAKRRLDAEQQLERWCAENGVRLTILRVAGIYGPDKLPVKRLEKATPVLNETESGFSNRIHIDDLITICHRVINQQSEFEIFNVSDGDPTTMTHYFNAVADTLGLSRPPLIDMATAQQSLSPAMLSYLTESRRIDNRKLLTQLGVVLKYPSLESGLEDINH